MKKKIFFSTLLILILMSFNYSLNAQTRAVTQYGDTIYVYNNGTWSYELLDNMPEINNELAYLASEIKIDTISKAFTAPANLKKQVKNKANQFIIKYDDSKWKRVPPATLNDEAEFAFESKVSDIWCVVISEETPIDSDKLFKIAKQTMKENTGGEPKIIKTELRKVNGKELIRGVLEADYSGITFIFDSYYYSDDLGSVQFITWTSSKVWERNENNILEFLNGFIAQ